MTAIRKIVKLLLLGGILLVLSLGSVFSGKREGNRERSFLGVQQARADVPIVGPNSGGTNSGGPDSGVDSGCGNSG